MYNDPQLNMDSYMGGPGPSDQIATGGGDIMLEYQDQNEFHDADFQDATGFESPDPNDLGLQNDNLQGPGSTQ